LGYDLHITRSPKGWFDNAGHEISAQEWLTIIEADPELRLAGYNSQYFALWSGPSRHQEPWFDWRRGNISTKSPDPPIVAKAISIADKLAAHVEGDDGEYYLSDGKVVRDGKIDQRPGMDWRTWS
jgi:hypothetical protein